MYKYALHKTLAEVTNSVLVILMLYAALRKIIDFKMFKNEMIFSLATINPENLLSVSLFCGIFIFAQSGLEISAACLLLTRKYRLTGFYLTISSLITAFIYLLIVVEINFRTSIFFGGILPAVSIGFHLIFNFIALIMVLAGMYLNEKKILSC